jgi:hypothetical protein
MADKVLDWNIFPDHAANKYLGAFKLNLLSTARWLPERIIDTTF